METMQSSGQSRFHAVVPTVAKFPLAIVIFSYIMLAINAFGLFNFFTNISAFIPGIGGGLAVDQIAIMISGRQLGAALVLLFALLYKNVRVMQLAWVIAMIREIADLALAQNNTGMFAFVIVLLVAEAATLIYLNAIASGKVAKYARHSA